ncbi:MAG: hypothetical protein M5U19_15290 [Microthrixaceae bacterium]|nr:hypothetical protein [Microthrixaceae bacterium]
MTAKSFYLGPDGTMTEAEPTAGESATRYNFDAELAETVTLPGDSTSEAFLALPGYKWNQEPKGSAAVFVSEPLAEDLVLAGGASADLWIRSSTPEADIGVTLSEVRPDGKETSIQAGVLRGSMRRPGPDATDLFPAQTGYEEDSEPMPVDEFAEARVEIFPFAHVIRKGSRIRLSVHTPVGTARAGPTSSPTVRRERRSTSATPRRLRPSSCFRSRRRSPAIRRTCRRAPDCAVSLAVTSWSMPTPQHREGEACSRVAIGAGGAAASRDDAPASAGRYGTEPPLASGVTCRCDVERVALVLRLLRDGKRRSA